MNHEWLWICSDLVSAGSCGYLLTLEAGSGLVVYQGFTYHKENVMCEQLLFEQVAAPKPQQTFDYWLLE